MIKLLVAPEGQMYVCRKRKMIGYAWHIDPQLEDDLALELMPEDQALKLEESWHPMVEPLMP